MTEESQVPPELNSFLEAWFATFSDHSLGQTMLLGVNIEAQLVAAKAILNRNKQAEADFRARLDALEQQAIAATGEHAQHVFDTWADQAHQSMYYDAAHSLAAAGILAPLVEGLAVALFRGLQAREESPTPPKHTSDRSRASRAHWDPHLVFNEGKSSTDIVGGIVRLSRTTGLAEYFPESYEPAFDALFKYRNKALHCGMEWPVEELKKFADTLQEKRWPESWFSIATRNHQPYIYYLTDSFITHILTLIDGILAGTGKYLRATSPPSASSPAFINVRPGVPPTDTN